ncbi:MAG: hypothetical protein ACOCXV_01625 [Bacteroidota bacterium]
MKGVLFVLFSLLLFVSAQSQGTRNVGVIVLIQDSLTHHYIGGSQKDHFSRKYAAPADFQSFASDTTLALLEENFHKWEFCTMDHSHFLVYEENREKLRATDFRDFRESWFNTLTEEYEVDAILVIRNLPSFSDAIHWSESTLTGYGIYNGPRRSYNNVYIQLEFLFFTSGRPLTHIQGPIYQREKDYPRADKKEDVLDENQLRMVEQPLKHLIISQIEAAISNANLLRALR